MHRFCDSFLSSLDVPSALVHLSFVLIWSIIKRSVSRQLPDEKIIQITIESQSSKVNLVGQIKEELAFMKEMNAVNNRFHETNAISSRQIWTLHDKRSISILVSYAAKYDRSLLGGKKRKFLAK